MSSRLSLVALVLCLGLVCLLGACGGDDDGVTHGTRSGIGGGEQEGTGGGTGGGDGPGRRAAIDQSTPRGLVEGIFAAAASGNLELLAGIADPEGSDGDAKNVAGVGEADAEVQADFKQYFSKGTISGEITEEGDRASVPILFGPDGTKRETFELVRRDGKWYLQSF